MMYLLRCTVYIPLGLCLDNYYTVSLLEIIIKKENEENIVQNSWNIVYPILKHGVKVEIYIPIKCSQDNN